MITFTVHEPPNPPADRVERAAGMVFVRDGFSWSAALFTPIWMLVYRLWWPLLGYIVAMAVIDIVRQVIELHPGWLTITTLALSVIIGLEANSLRRWSLARGGWTTVGAVSGRTQEECERRFYDMWLATPPQHRLAGPAEATPPAPTGRDLRGALSPAEA